MPAKALSLALFLVPAKNTELLSGRRRWWPRLSYQKNAAPAQDPDSSPVWVVESARKDARNLETNISMKPRNEQIQQSTNSPTQCGANRNACGGKSRHSGFRVLATRIKIMPQLLVLFLVCASRAWAGYGAVQAQEAGLISLSGYASSGYSEVVLYVDNYCGYGIDVDFSTMWCLQGNGSQRIGLCYEKSIGSYYLHLRAHGSYTFRFSSRCLDHSRNGPSTGTSFSRFVSFASDFYAIRDALRNGDSQTSIWDLSDYSYFSDLWHDAYPAPTYRADIDLSCPVSWATSGSYITLKAQRVQNYNTTYTTGALRLRVWATRSRYTGGTITGYVLGTYNMSPLRAGYYYSNISGRVALTRPPRGTYYTTMTVEESTPTGWFIRDYVNFTSANSF
jgi:hypothetical protein